MVDVRELNARRFARRALFISRQHGQEFPCSLFDAHHFKKKSCLNLATQLSEGQRSPRLERRFLAASEEAEGLDGKIVGNFSVDQRKISRQSDRRSRLLNRECPLLRAGWSSSCSPWTTKPNFSTSSNAKVASRTLSARSASLFFRNLLVRRSPPQRLGSKKIEKKLILRRGRIVYGLLFTVAHVLAIHFALPVVQCTPTRPGVQHTLYISLLHSSFCAIRVVSWGGPRLSSTTFILAFLYTFCSTCSGSRMLREVIEDHF